jgi:hypothetical protein
LALPLLVILGKRYSVFATKSLAAVCVTVRSGASFSEPSVLLNSRLLFLWRQSLPSVAVVSSYASFALV